METSNNSENKNEPPITSDQTPPTGVVVGDSSANKKRWIVIIVAVLLLGAGIAAYFMWGRKSDPKTTTSNTTSSPKGEDYSLAPRFTSVQAYIPFDGADWYAVDGGVIRVKQGSKPVYYAQREGVPQGVPTSMVAHENTLWLAAQNGVATLKADQSGFETVAFSDKLANGTLYRDEDANKLYLSSFEKFYVYDNAAKTWKAEPNGPNTPLNLQSFGANKDYQAASMNGQDMPVWVYNKKTSKWALNRPTNMGDSIPTVFTLDDQLFVMGRTKGYQSCEQSGKVTATSAFRLDESGQWQPLTNFNADKTRPELNLAKHVKDPTAVMIASPCGAQAERTKYKVSYKDGDLQLEKIGVVSDKDAGFMGDDGEQQVVVDELAKATGLYPFIRVLASDKDNNLIFGYSKSASRNSTPTIEGVAIAKGTDFTQATALMVADATKYHALVPIVCDGSLSYIFAGVFGAEPREGFPDGTWTTTSLLSVNGSTTQVFADLQKNVGEPRFACSNGKISWVGTSAVQQLDIASKAITSTGSGLPTSSAQQTQSVYPLDNGDLWALLPLNKDKPAGQASLYHFASSTKELKKIGTYTSAGLVGGTATHAWLAETFDTNSEAFRNLAIYALDGTKTTKNGDFLRLGLANSEAVIAKASAKADAFSIFMPFTVVTYELGKEEQAIPETNVPARTLRLGTEVGAHNYGVFDSKRNQMWFSDDLLGSFAIDL